jgi:Protein kinase domain
MMATRTIPADDGNDYEVLPDVLGDGGQGSVHLGRRIATGDAVAIKRILGGARREPARNRELQIALKLGQQSPPHLLAPLTWLVDGDDLLLVMSLAERSLADELIAYSGGLPEDALLLVLRDVTAGLVELAEAGILHRDLKPGNVLLHAGAWRLADFGMSRDLDVRTATTTFTHGGTPPYWAPERWRGQPATAKSDLYALGCLAHELATGAWPFPGRDMADQQYQHLHTPAPATPVSPTLARWILRLLDKDPARRPQDAAAALSALPAAAPPPGSLAAAALGLERRQQQHAAEAGHRTTAAENRAAARRQALADLADLCANAAEHARQQLPDLRWDDHGDVHRFHIDDTRLDLILWPQADLRSEGGLVLAGEVVTVIRGQRRLSANLVCEMHDGRQHWYLDAFTRHPLAPDVIGSPTGFPMEDLLIQYRKLHQGGDHSWERHRQLLSPDVIIEVLTELLHTAARP